MGVLRRLIIFFLLFSSLLVLGLAEAYASASSCLCVAAPYTKKYQGFSEHWWGTKRSWSCEYHCVGPAGEVSIIGEHKNWYVRKKDDGRESVCDGIPFINQYNAFAQDFVYIPQAPVEFDPAYSSAPNLRAWAIANCRN